MAIAKLPVNFKDDVIDTSANDKRRYNLITNSDGTTSLEDVTTYEQIGSNFDAEQVNQTNEAVNGLIDGFNGIGNGSTVAKESEHALTADEAAHATNSDNANTAQTALSAKNDFILVNKSTLVFDALNVCEIIDERITEDSLADVYFTQETFNTAESAVIDVETFIGKVKLTAGRTPDGTIVATIHIRVV